MTTARASVLAALLLVAAAALRAQEPPQGPPPGGMAPRQGRPGRGPGPGPMQGPFQGPEQGPRPGDPLMGNLFPPELIMQNQEAIGLTEEQRTFMIGEVQRTQGQVFGTQWRLQSAVERLGAMVRGDHPDEAQALQQLDSVLALEREMKRAQIGLLVRLKARLTPEQQAMLRQRMPQGPPGPREQ